MMFHENSGVRARCYVSKRHDVLDWEWPRAWLAMEKKKNGQRIV